MPLPANWSTVTVTGTYLNIDGEPLKGAVAFSTTTRVVDAGANVTVPPSVRRVSLDKDGKFSVVLPATDDPDVAPTGFAYRVDEDLVLPTGARSLTNYLIQLPAAAATVDLADVVPVTPVGEVSPYLRRVDIAVVDVTAGPYHAVGDGVADDTAAIQAAITAAQASAAGTQVYFPPGRTFKVTAPLTVNPFRCSLVGGGPAHTVIEFSGLSAGQYAITYVFTVGSEPTAKRLPYVGARDLTIRQATPYAAGRHGIRMGTDVTGQDGYGLTFDHVRVEGFGDQVTYLSRTYVSSWSNCHFAAAQTRGVVLPTAGTAGERIVFSACTFDNSPGTLVEISGTGTDAYFYGCSFDYSGRALNIRGGQAQFFGCHFETNNALRGSFTEYIRVDRNGSNPLPQVLISGGMFFPWWTEYDTAIRVTGTTFGEAILQVRDLRVFADATTTCPYLIRDDGPAAANIAYSGIVFSDTTVPLPEYRDQSGVGHPITQLGGNVTAKSARPTRRLNTTAVEPVPATQVSASGAVASGTIYHMYFRPTEDIEVAKVAAFVAGTAAAGVTLAKTAVYRSGVGGALTKLGESSGATFGTVTFSRAEVSLVAPVVCRAGSIYALSLLFVATTPPALASIPNVGGYLSTSSTYGHPIMHHTTGQADMPASIPSGSLAGGNLMPYLVGSAI